MKMRSAAFLTLSLVVHAVCVAALAISHFKSIGGSSPSDSVEMTVGETPAAVVAVTEPTKQEPVKAKIRSAKKPVKAAPAPEIATNLPAKEEVPENMSPEIDDSDMVAVEEAPEVTPTSTTTTELDSDEKVELIPVKEKLAAVEPMDESGFQNEGVSQGGDSQSTAVNYLELKQFSGNKLPEYPLRARKEQRQGAVDLLYRVTKDGHVAEIQIAKSSGHADLDEAAVKAIAKYKFVPGQEGWARHPVIFTLKASAQ